MILKIQPIKNCGKFLNYTSNLGSDRWNGTFAKVNTIYAENGFGKTTLTQILKSLSSGDNDSINKRQSIGAHAPVYAKVVTDGGVCTFSKGRWDKNVDHIEVFDAYYAEENIYVVDLGTYDSPSSFYDIVKDGKRLIRLVSDLRHQRSKLTDSIGNIRSNIKKETNQAKIDGYQKGLEARLEKREEVKRLIEEKEKLLNAAIDDVLVKYSEKINEYLMRFNPNLKLGRFSKESNKLVYELYINNVMVKSPKISQLSLRHSLSEGDKSALSLSFFLARLALLPSLKDSIIVFDDPISSFDTKRRMSTVNALVNTIKNANQAFILSHDLNFIKTFTDNAKRVSPTNIKIYWKEGSSHLGFHDLKRDASTDLAKRLNDLQDFLDHGSDREDQMRHVVANIRPVIEGIFRLKYFRHVHDNQWLGDFLRMIEQADEGSPLLRLAPIANDISLLNDYSKRYHHNNPNYMEEPISPAELASQVSLALRVVELI